MGSDPGLSVITRHVLNFLDLHSVLQACQVSQSWRENITSGRSLWQKHFRFYKNQITCLIFEQRPYNGACATYQLPLEDKPSSCPLVPCRRHLPDGNGYHPDWLVLFDKFEKMATGQELQVMVQMFYQVLNDRPCTYTQTQKQFSRQVWFHCKTCKLEDSLGICSVCVFTCHATHDVSYAGDTDFFCDCGDPENKKATCCAQNVNETPAGKIVTTKLDLTTLVKCAPIFAICKFGSLELFHAYARLFLMDVNEKIRVKGYDKDSWFEYEETPLGVAVSANNAEIAEFILPLAADKNPYFDDILDSIKDLFEGESDQSEMDELEKEFIELIQSMEDGHEDDMEEHLQLQLQLLQLYGV